MLLLDSVQEIKSGNYGSPVVAGDTSLSIKIYSDDRRRSDRAWGEFKRRMNANIKVMTISDDVIKKIINHDLEKVLKLERDFDVQIQVDQSKGSAKIQGHIDDISNIQEEIRKVLNDVENREREGKILICIVVHITVLQSWIANLKRTKRVYLPDCMSGNLRVYLSKILIVVDQFLLNDLNSKVNTREF